MDINGKIGRTLKRSDFGRRIGVAGYRAITNLTHRSDADPVMVNTLAKAGTHLLMSLLDAFPAYRFSGRHFTFSVIDLHEPELTERNARLARQMSKVRRGQYMTGHLAYHDSIARTVDDAGFRQLLVVRDPRALIVSGALYMRSYERHPLHATVARRFTSDADVIRGVIAGFDQDNGTRHLRPMSERLDAFVPWLDEPGALLVRFEDLVGSAGGGTDELQFETARRISEHLGLDAGPDTVRAAASAAFDTRAATFRSGEIEGWRRHLDGELLELAEESCRAASAKLGYVF
ncbi:hypothetical protein [Microbacterium schleiferi]|uniref:hypothetical protein n=1 Tax=Microbacterium schleiferi TaxID=69362 RepID=UPI00312023A9